VNEDFAEVTDTFVNSSIGGSEPGAHGKLPVDITVLIVRYAGLSRDPAMIYGWRLIVTADTKTRTLMNFLAQAGGADVMRLVSIVATECGITIAAPVHDAFWILAPLDELDTTIARMSEIMTEAGRQVAGIPIRVKVEAVVRWPQCLGDVRKPDAKGQAMWCEVRELVRNGGLQKVSHG